MIPKFRAWEPYKNKMNYKVMVGNCDTDDENWTCPIIWDKEKREWVHFDSTDYIMQSTGLKDKNGVEIFEGDVVYDEKVDEIGQIELKDGCFRTITSHYDTLLYKLNNDLKIIGNIYENPELVEVER